MRIIAGKYKGRRFDVSKKFKARPTTDLAREGLFNVLRHRGLPEGSDVLDLFFGTGAVSLEFISRGAHTVTGIDINADSKRNLRQITSDWGIDNLKVIHADVFKILKNPKGKFDIVFADPPFADKRLGELPDLVLESGWIDGGGFFILEHGSEYDFADHPRYEEMHRFGNVHFSFFR
jgi:16S rRNA (guanine(966)-N(2))-methyltransferase RsmD